MTKLPRMMYRGTELLKAIQRGRNRLYDTHRCLTWAVAALIAFGASLLAQSVASITTLSLVTLVCLFTAYFYAVRFLKAEQRRARWLAKMTNNVTK